MYDRKKNVVGGFILLMVQNWFQSKQVPKLMGVTNILVRLALVANKTDLYSRNKKKVWSGLPSPEEVADAETVDVASYCSGRRSTMVVRCYKL